MKIENIIQYHECLERIHELMKKGEDNLTVQELNEIAEKAKACEEYEDNNRV